jgi:hypothetical protein
MTDPLDLQLRLAEVRAAQGKPAAPSGPRRRRIPNPDAPPPPPDVAELAAHDYDDDDLERSAPPPPARPIPEHLRQYLVKAPATSGRLEASRRQLGGTKDDPVIIGNDHGWLGCDWPGLARMAAARTLAGLDLDDLDEEALKRAGWVPIEGAWIPPSASSSSSSSAPASTPSASQ